MHDLMTPRERWNAVLRGEEPDRLPLDYQATPEFDRKLMDYLQCGSIEELYQALHIDRPFLATPRYQGPPLEADTDVFGRKYKKIFYQEGYYPECVHHPLAEYSSVEEIEANYTWPDPDWYDFSGLKDQVAEKEKIPIRTNCPGFFLVYKDIRGQEQAMMDMALHPELVRYCIGKILEFYREYMSRIYHEIAEDVLISYVKADLGGQENLLYSPEHIREFFFPWMKEMIDLAHQAGIYAFHHDDGSIRKILPELIELGIDILNPVQWRTKGMDREELKNEFGDRLVFHGGVDNQQTLAFGSQADIRQEIIDNIRILGREGGYILAPCHNIQVVSPPENIVVMYKTAYEHGWY